MRNAVANFSKCAPLDCFFFSRVYNILAFFSWGWELTKHDCALKALVRGIIRPNGPRCGSINRNVSSWKSPSYYSWVHSCHHSLPRCGDHWTEDCYCHWIDNSPQFFGSMSRAIKHTAEKVDNSMHGVQFMCHWDWYSQSLAHAAFLNSSQLHFWTLLQPKSSVPHTVR